MNIFDVFKKKPKISDSVEPEYKDLLTEAHERWLAAVDADHDQRELEVSDLQFCKAGGQWDSDVKSQREAEGRPCMEVDRINTFVRNVCNEMRQMRPQPQVNPVGNGASKETAEVLQGMIRHISYQSNGDTAIDAATESMVRCGRGYFRVITDYSEPDSFEQDIFIKRIPNPHMVYLDPSASEPDGSDANWAFISVDMSREMFRREFPKSKLSEMSKRDWTSLGDEIPEWAMRDGSGVRVIEYFKRVRVPVEMALLADGSVVKEADVPEGETPVDTREVLQEKVLWYKLSPVEVLEKTEWAGKYIPIVPVYGSELIVDGKRTWSGLVRTAKGPQSLYNYMKSAQAEAIALAPKAPVIAAKGSLGTGAIRAAWNNINKKALSVVEYEPIVNGQPVPPPQRLSNEVDISGITAALMGSVDDLKAVTGMYDPTLGNREGGQSGVAIQRLQRQGQVGNYHYTDNLARSVRHLGRILIDLIPKIYDTQRIVRIIKPDETSDLVTINGPTGQKDKTTGMERIFDVRAGKYDVTVSVGPSYQSQKQEGQAVMESLMQGPFGQLLTTVAPDLVLSLFDSPIDPKILERIKKAIPPQFQDENEEEGAEIPPQLLQQMQAMVEQLQQAEAAMQEIEAERKEIQSKLDNKQLELESKERIATLNAQVELIKLQATQDGQAAMFMLENEIQAINQRLALLNIGEPMPQSGTEPVIPAGPQIPDANAGGPPLEGEM